MNEKNIIIEIEKDVFEISYKEIKKDNTLLSSSIYKITKNNIEENINEINSETLIEIFKKIPNFKNFKQHFIPRFILEKWKTNKTKNKKTMKAASFQFDFKEGLINPRNLSIYYEMQGTQFYNKKIESNEFYTLEGGFINNISENHIQNILSYKEDFKINSKNFNLKEKIHYELLSSIYYINYRGDDSFFNEIFDLIINSNDFILDYKNFLLRKNEDFYRVSLSKGHDYDINIINFEEDLLYLNDAWGLFLKLQHIDKSESFMHIIPINKNKAIVISNYYDVKNFIIKNKNYVKNSFIKDSMNLSQKKLCKSNLLIFNDKSYVDNILSCFMFNEKILLKKSNNKLSKKCVKKPIAKLNKKIVALQEGINKTIIKPPSFNINNKYYSIAITSKNYLVNPYEICNDSEFYLCSNYKCLFENKIFNTVLNFNTQKISDLYYDKYKSTLKIERCYV